MDISATIAQLRRLVPEAATLPGSKAQVRPFGVPEIDGALGGGLRPGALHEIYAASAREAGAASGFTLGLAGLLMRAGDMPLLWLRQTMAEREYGRPHAPGLAEMGLDPRRLMLVSASRTEDVLEAALQAARGLKRGVVLLEPYGMARELDLTASRRLGLAAEAAEDVTLLALFTGRAAPCPSPALTRWRISAAPAMAGPRHILGLPRLRVELTRSRTGQTGDWFVEWNSDASIFNYSQNTKHSPELHSPGLSRPAIPVPADRPPAADHGGWRRAG